MIITIVGPTGVGKTKLSIELAKIYNGEIINADSTQIYKYLNIGTSKITEKEQEGIRHHLFDIKEPNEKYTIFDYQKEGRIILNDILNHHKTAIVVGGSGLYIKALLYDYTFKESDNNISYELYSDTDLYQKLLSIDNSSDIPKNNRQRIIRALNYYIENGMPISMNNDGKNKLLYDAKIIGLTTDREILYQNIRRKSELMIENGLLKEVKSLHNRYPNSAILNNAIGYKEIINYYNGKYNLEETITEIKNNSTSYAKRQYTWFNNQMDIKWFNVDFNDFMNTVNSVKDFIDKET